MHRERIFRPSCIYFEVLCLKNLNACPGPHERHPPGKPDDLHRLEQPDLIDDYCKVSLRHLDADLEVQVEEGAMASSLTL